MKTRLTQIFLMVVVGLIGVLSTNAQQTYKINTLLPGQTLRTNQGLRSENGMYNAIMQVDGNFCLYKDGENFIHCTMTVGDKDKMGYLLKMQEDGNLALYNSKDAHLWSTDTYRGGDEKQGGKLVLENDGRLILYSRSGKAIYDFKNGRLY